MARTTNPFEDTKILGHLDRLAQWRHQGIAAPVLLDLNLTNRCNHACPDCNGYGYKGVHPRAELTTTQAVGIMIQSAQMGVRALTLSGGGEPLLSTALPSVLRTAHDHGIKVGLITNGQALTSDMEHLLVQYCQWVRFSLDADGPALYQKVHGACADWELVTQNIRRFCQREDRPAVGVSYLVGDHTVTSCAAAGKLAKELGADYIQFRPFRGADTDLGRVRDAASKLAGRNGFGAHVTDCGRGIGRMYSVCHAQHFVMMIAATGDMYRCCEQVIKEREGPIGNALTETLMEIWYGERRRKRLDTSVAGCPVGCRNHPLNDNLERMFVREREHGDFV